jgi:FAD:protein FMN transferase
MRSCPHPERWVTRAQTWLGTLVEVALPPLDAHESRFAEAFAAVAQVHRTMSAHDPTSDVARVARDAHRRPVKIDPGTYAVLELALTLFRETRGAFDVAIAPLLTRNGLLPEMSVGQANYRAGMDALRLEGGSFVHAEAPVAVDLGGIAKGYAVDRAVDALRVAGASAGIVNAGGDLRVFGASDWMPIRVRHPAAPTLAVPLFDVRDAAVATSSDNFRDESALVDPRTQSLRTFPGSITVVAPSCALADALTKVVALCPGESAAILARHGSHAFVLDAPDVRSRRHFATTCSASTANLRLALAAA